MLGLVLPSSTSSPSQRAYKAPARVFEFDFSIEKQHSTHTNLGAPSLHTRLKILIPSQPPTQLNSSQLNNNNGQYKTKRVDFVDRERCDYDSMLKRKYLYTSERASLLTQPVSSYERLNSARSSNLVLQLHGLLAKKIPLGGLTTRN